MEPFIVLASLALVPCWGEPLGSFAAPLAVSSGRGGASQPDLGLLGFSYLMAYVEDGQIKVHLAGAVAPVWSSGDVPLDLEARPRLATTEAGQLALLFQAPAAPPSGGNEPGLWLVERLTGSFEDPVTVASPVFYPSPHAIGYSSRGRLDYVWAAPSSPGEGLPTLELQLGSATIPLGRGGRPVLAAGPFGFVHVAYVREGRAWYRSDHDEADFSRERVVFESAPVHAVALAVDGAETPHFALETAAGLLYLKGSGEAASDALLVAPRGREPRLQIGASGSLALSFLDGAALYLARGRAAPAAFAAPEAIFLPAAGEQVLGHELRLDPLGRHHVAFELGGEVYYTTDVPPPVARIGVEAHVVRQGDPLAFADLSEGVITYRRWRFGDGEESREPSPSHRYLEPGWFSVSLTVSGPGGTSEYVLAERVQVLPATEILSIPSLRAHPGDEIVVPALLSSSMACRGFQLVVKPSAHVELREPSFGATETAVLQAEFLDVRWESAGEEAALVIAVLWDYEAPFDGRVLPAGKALALLLLRARLAPEAAAGASEWIRLVNHFGPQDKSTLIVSAADIESVYPFTRDGKIDVVGGGEGTFLRGDANGDLEVDVSDAIAILGYLFLGDFLGDGAPLCPDSLDRNDDGAIDVSDAIDTLQFLFSGAAAYPAYPHPAPGLDPTADSLAPCPERS